MYSKRDGKKIRKTFPTQAAAKAWRQDAQPAVRKQALRVPTPVTLDQAARELIAGMRDGSIPTRSGSRYKPAATRSYEEALRLRIRPSWATCDFPTFAAATCRG